MGEYCHHLVLIPKDINSLEEVWYDPSEGMKAMFEQLLDGNNESVISDDTYHEDQEMYDFDDLVRCLKQIGYIIYTEHRGSYVTGHSITNFTKVIMKHKGLIKKVLGSDL